MSYGPPPLNGALPVQDKRALWSQPWANWLMASFTMIFDVQNSGTTANRPTKGLYTGKPYFDTTLGKPIWYKTAGWVDATGAGV